MTAKMGSEVARFRHHRARAVAGMIVTISVLTLVAVSWWFALLLIPPLAWTVWVWRAGTDVDRGGLRVRALLGDRKLAWHDVDTVYVDRHGRVIAGLTHGGELPLTAVTAADLPLLMSASGRSGGDAATAAG